MTSRVDSTIPFSSSLLATFLFTSFSLHLATSALFHPLSSVLPLLYPPSILFLPERPPPPHTTSPPSPLAVPSHLPLVWVSFIACDNGLTYDRLVCHCVKPAVQLKPYVPNLANSEQQTCLTRAWAETTRSGDFFGLGTSAGQHASASCKFTFVPLVGKRLTNCSSTRCILGVERLTPSSVQSISLLPRCRVSLHPWCRASRSILGVS